MRRLRAGFSLIEMLIVMTVLSTAISVVSLSLYRASMFQRDIQWRTQNEVTLSRLARMFRDDAHRAIAVDDKAQAEDKADRVKDQTELRLTMPDGSVVAYRAIGAQCERTVTANGEWKHREVFHGSPQIAFALELKRDENSQLLTIRVTRNPLISNSRSGERHVDHPVQPLPWISIEAVVPQSPGSKERSS